MLNINFHDGLSSLRLQHGTWDRCDVMLYDRDDKEIAIPNDIINLKDLRDNEGDDWDDRAIEVELDCT